MPHESVFRVIIGSRIAIPPIPLSNNAPVTQTHNFNSDTTYQTVSYITLKSFMTFDIIFCRPIFNVVVEGVKL